MVYQFKNGHVTWHSFDNGREIVKPVAIPLDESLTFGERIIFAMLLDWLENETHARALVRAVAKMFPNKLGCGEAGEFRIGYGELREAILMVFNHAIEHKFQPVSVEYMGGQRRDTLRLT